LEPGDKDEALSWRAATAIMMLASLGTLATSDLGLDPFSWVFDALIVYVPALVLLGALIVNRTKYGIRRTAQSTPGDSLAEHREA
jgi:hypothetical protein